MKKIIVVTAVAFGATFIPLNSFENKNIENNINNGILGLYLDQGKNSDKSQGGQKPENSQDKQQSKQQEHKQQPNKNQPEKEQQNKNQAEKESTNKNQNNKSVKGNKQDNNRNVFKENKKENRNDKNSPSNFKNNNKAQKNNFKHPYKYGSNGKWYSYGNNQGFYLGKNYGQWRSAQARNKHKQFQPRYEYEAIGAYVILADRNVFLFNQTDSKIIFVRSRLIERRDAGLITVVEYDNNIRRIELIEQRRAAIEINIAI